MTDDKTTNVDFIEAENADKARPKMVIYSDTGSTGFMDVCESGLDWFKASLLCQIYWR